jgi:hypothetical protein
VTFNRPLDRADSDELILRAAQIEANTRRVNEAIEAGTDEDQLVFLCECGRVDCGMTIRLGHDAYEAVRTDFDRFLVAPGHVLPEIEEVAEHYDGYLVVRKRAPAARRLVAATDPRSAG